MVAKSIAAALIGCTLAGAAAAPAEARHYHGRDGYHRGYYGHHGYGRRCSDPGNGGLAIGAVAGGLAGNLIAGHHDRTLGTVLGAVGGGLLGRSIDRSDGRPC